MLLVWEYEIHVFGDIISCLRNYWEIYNTTANEFKSMSDNLPENTLEIPEESSRKTFWEPEKTGIVSKMTLTMASF